MHNQLSAYGIGDDWNDHIARGSAGGVDFLTPVGTPIEATEDGYLSNIPYNGTGGHTATLIRDANHSTQFMHLSQFVAGDRYVKEFDIIGYTGGAKGSDGAGSSTGPHCHAHSYEFSQRVPPFFLSAAAGSPTAPPDRKAPRMNVLLVHGDLVPDIYFLLHLDEHKRSWVPYGAELQAWTLQFGAPKQLDQKELDAIPFRPGQTLWDGSVTK